MHLSILLAAWLSFGQLSFDVSPVATALDRSLETLRDRNLRAVTKRLDKVDPNDQEGELVIRIHAVTKEGHYYEWEFPSSPLSVTCHTHDRSFTFEKKPEGWMLAGLQPPKDARSHTQNFLAGTYQELFFYAGHTISEYLQAPGFVAARMPLGRNRTLMWGHSPGGSRPFGTPVQFRAIVRFSDSGRLAFNEWSESNAYYSTPNSDSTAVHVIATSNARFASEAFDCQTIDLNRTQYPNCKTEQEIKACTTAVPLRSRTVLSSDIRVKEEQLTTAYYGVSDETTRRMILQSSQMKPIPIPTGSRPRQVVSESTDLAIAIGIPTVLLALLLIVIRKT